MSFLSKDQYIFLELGEDESGEVKLITYTFSENDDGTAKKDSKQSKPEADDPEYKKVLIAKNCVEYYEAATILKQTKEELVKLPESPKLLHHKVFLDEVNSYFHRWAKINSISDPLNTSAVKVYKKDKYLRLFKQFYDDRNADQEIVKSVLNDSGEWINASKYLADARKELKISVKDLKLHPGFTWIDPKGTAKDQPN